MRPQRCGFHCYSFLTLHRQGVQWCEVEPEATWSISDRHATLDAARALFWKVFEDLSLERTPRIFVEALERCGNARRGHERQEVVGFMDEL